MAQKKDAEPVLVFKVISECAGEKRAKYSGQKPKYKKYQIGEQVKGHAFNASQTPSGYMPVLMTTDGYAISMGNLMFLTEEQVAQIVDDKKDFEKTIKEKFSLMAGNSTDLIGDQQKKSKYLVNGAMIGGVSFFLYAMAKGHKKWSVGLLGVLIGGFVGKAWANYRINNK